MASNRKLPFGYRMEQGEIKEHPTEAATVREIFQRYLAGASYKILVEYLRGSGLAYDGDKLWNKNMVARILENDKYTGEDNFPALVPPEEFQRAQKQRKSKAVSSVKTPAQKELRRLCGGNPPKYVEGQVLGVLNQLIHNPEIVKCSEDSPQDNPEIQRLRQELDNALHAPPVDEERTRKMSFQLAALLLNSIGSEEYETQCLQRLFQNQQPMTVLDRDILRRSVRRITYKGKTAEILLKNGQIVREE